MLIVITILQISEKYFFKTKYFLEIINKFFHHTFVNKVFFGF